MKTLTEQDLAVVQRVIDTADRERTMIGAQRFPQQGQFVTTGFQMAPSIERYVGFCVQVRKGCGQFGSDMVFLRHPSGLLVTHENQAFFALSEEHEALVRGLYDPEDLPEAEDYSVGYRCVNKVHETGFLIERADTVTPATPATPVRLTVRGGASGDDLLEDIVIL